MLILFCHLSCWDLGSPNRNDLNSSINNIEDNLSKRDFLIWTDSIKLRTQEWNNHINNKEYSLLKNKYIQNPTIYLDDISLDSCILLKKKWLDSRPSYHQEIKQIQVYYINNDSFNYEWIVSFDKVIGTKIIPSFLVFQLIDNQWKIKKESDWITEGNKFEKSPKQTLNQGDYAYSRSFIEVFESDSLGQQLVQSSFRLEFSINESSVSGYFALFDGKSKVINDYEVISGNIENGILSLQMIPYGEDKEEFKNRAYEYSFKLVGEDTIVSISPNFPDLLGRPLIRYFGD